MGENRITKFIKIRLKAQTFGDLRGIINDRKSY